MNSDFSKEPPEQPEILLQLRQKAAELRQTYAVLKDENKQLSQSFVGLSDRLDVLLREKQIQERKSRSLMLLVADLQRQLDDTYMEVHREEEPQKLQSESKALREILIKTAELVKEDQKMLSFLRQVAASGPKAAQFVQRSRYLQGQSQLMAKLRSQISSFVNQNLECSRKWNDLQRQSKRLQKQQGLLRIQSERIKRDLREHYEDYLQRLNRSKATIVNFNQTQRQKVITENLIEEVALLQEKRSLVQEQFRDLKHHQESLLEQNARIQMENRQLRSFFNAPDSNQQHRLATKMRLRVEQLRDYLSQMQRLRNLPQLPLNEISEIVRVKLKQIEESQKYIEKKIRDEEQGKMVIEQKDVINFFEGVIRGRDERIQIAKEKEISAAQRLRESKVKKELLQSQIQNLDEGLKYHSYYSAGGLLNASKTRVEGARIEQVSKWKDRRMNATNLQTTTSKFVS